MTSQTAKQEEQFVSAIQTKTRKFFEVEKLNERSLMSFIFKFIQTLKSRKMFFLKVVPLHTIVDIAGKYRQIRLS